MYRKNQYTPEFEIRRSQLLTPFGVGALTGINNQSIMVADSEYWKEDQCNKIHDVRLESIMKCSGFIEPPTKELSEVSGIRFPSWYFSPLNRKLKKIETWREMVGNVQARLRRFERTPFYQTAELVPVRIICACTNGHAQDFPWLEWVHQKSNINNYQNHELQLFSDGISGSISDLKVYCETCKITEPLKNLFDEVKLSEIMSKINVQCCGLHIWKKDDRQSVCDKPLKVLLRNANNFYFPNISVSVNIPLVKNRLLESMQQSEYYNFLEMVIRKKDEFHQVVDDPLFQNIIEKINEEIGYTTEQITQTIKSKFFLEDKELNLEVMNYRKLEFDVLSGVSEFDEKAGKLRIEKFEYEEFKQFNYSEKISNITLVHELEVVSALKSYTRINASDSDLMREQIYDGIKLEDAPEVSLKRLDNYYVGLKSSGEGIFISLNPALIRKWSQKIKETSAGLNIKNKRRKDTLNYREEFMKPEYYLLHTLSHILIKELSDYSGYSSSSLKERIYFSTEENEEMFGVLIYTSSSDSEGTLGGLVRQGIPSKFFETLELAIEKSKWCSFDPVCIESDEQGRDSLNAAACHACCLVSETSCEHMNSCLDRRMLIGTLEDSSTGYFS